MGQAEVKERVQRILTEKGTIGIDGDGDFTFQAGSSRVFIRVSEREGTDTTIVAVFAPVLRDVQPSPELFEFIAREGGDYFFGHLSFLGFEDGTSLLLFKHNLLGDYLDPEELHWVVGAVGGTADDLDDDLQAKFGGKRVHED